MAEISQGERPQVGLGIEALQAELKRERARTREVDHRAKNSLQLVSSLLLLMSRRSTQPDTQKALKAMHQRITAIAAVHREILDAEHDDRFDLTGFVREHVAALAQTCGDGASLRLDLSPVELDTAKACPAALIVNELALNALTHGRPPDGAPQAEIVLRPAASGFALTVQDHGGGLPADADQRGFGLTIVKLMAQQISHRVAFEDAQPGLRATVTAA